MLSRSWRRWRGRADRLLPASVAERARALSRAFGEGPIVASPAGEHLVVVAPHPDDETLMCGGTIAGHVDAGGRATLIAVTDGEHGGDPVLSVSEAAEQRRAEQEAAAEVLGVGHTIRLGLPDGAVARRHDELTELLSLHLTELAPDVVLTPWWMESHADHAAVARAVAAAVPDHPEVWSGEVWTPLVPNRLVDVTGFMDRKRAAIDCYRIPNAAVELDALAALSRYRSAFGLRGTGNAEAFVALTSAAFRRAAGGVE